MMVQYTGNKDGWVQPACFKFAKVLLKERLVIGDKALAKKPGSGFLVRAVNAILQAIITMTQISVDTTNFSNRGGWWFVWSVRAVEEEEDSGKDTTSLETVVALKGNIWVLCCSIGTD